MEIISRLQATFTASLKLHWILWTLDRLTVTMLGTSRKLRWRIKRTFKRIFLSVVAVELLRYHCNSIHHYDLAVLNHYNYMLKMRFTKNERRRKLHLFLIVNIRNKWLTYSIFCFLYLITIILYNMVEGNAVTDSKYRGHSRFVVIYSRVLQYSC